MSILARPATRIAKTGTRRRIPMPRRLRGRFSLLFGSFLLLIMIVLCVGAPLFTRYDPIEIDALNPLLPMFSPGHLFGTDEFGRDVFARVLYGGRYDLAIAFAATFVTLVVGTLMGLIAGHVGGRTETIIMRIVDLFFAFPFIVLVIAIIASLGSSLINLFIALWVVSWVSYARISHGQTLSAKRYGYVVAATALGFSNLRIMFAHILPSVLPGVIIFAMVDAVGNVLLGASLGFLGVGIPQPTPEWGSMIAEGQNFILSNWYLSIMPGAALVVLGVALSLIGDGLADMLRTNR
ncbi:peptide/nickel transport system permease protein [Nakamurella sp. UYEF19]|uniref:ABC transporter permease n=1 Tax=Nakamurella sp. UYEF19 TaxID=1756392 RepID=UPI0033987F01